MTIKNISRKFSAVIADAWLGEQYAGPDRAVDDVPLNRAPDRWGETNPDSDTTRLEWDIDFDAAEEAAWAEMQNAVVGGAKPAQSEVSAAVNQMQAWLGRGQSPTNAQRDATIDAIAVLLRDLWQRP